MGGETLHSVFRGLTALYLSMPGESMGRSVIGTLKVSRVAGDGGSSKVYEVNLYQARGF